MRNTRWYIIAAILGAVSLIAASSFASASDVTTVSVHSSDRIVATNDVISFTDFDYTITKTSLDVLVCDDFEPEIQRAYPVPEFTAKAYSYVGVVEARCRSPGSVSLKNLRPNKEPLY